ncbi:hypothetical protein [Streptomyces alboflavus]|uniref:hypothetical protein n=1 Tax=Streptomyces alboflavus TaxID=67267 RepID=UPI000F65843A|nr:hypothetical protein [Streptomyces alboflavus]
MRHEITQRLAETPGWVLAAVLGTVALAVVLAAYAALGKVGRALWRNRVRSRLTKRRQLEEAGRTAAERPGLQTLVDQWAMVGGFIGMTASMWGLWHFAADQAGLPPYLQITFVAVLDGTEFGLFLGLFLAVRTGAKRLTPAMRHSHRLAWGLALLSSAAQIAEAQTLPGKVAMGFLPIIAAILIDSRLRQILADNRGQDEDEDAQPGPVRLLTLMWAKAWARIFAALGLDASASSTAGARRAQVRRAARLTQLHGQARRTAQDQALSHRASRRARRRAARLGAKALEARTTAGIADDDAQKLAFVRLMAWLSSDSRLADHDWTDRDGTLALLDTLDVAETHELVSLEERTQAARAALAQVESARQDSERARQTAEQQAKEARQRSDAAATRAEEAGRQLATATEAAERARQDTIEAHERASTARQAAETAQDDLTRAREETAAARQEFDGLKKRAEDARREITRAREEAAAARQTREEETAALAAIRTDTAQASDGQREAAKQARELAARVQSAQGTLTTLCTQIEEAQLTLTARTQAADEAAQRLTDAQDAQEQARSSAWDALALEREARAALAATTDAVVAQVAENGAELAAALPQPGQPLFPKSDGKQRAWETFRLHRQQHGEGEPKPADLAALGGVAESRARAWLAEFRDLHPRVIAAEAARRSPAPERTRAPEHTQPSAPEHSGHHGPWPPRTAEHQPSTPEHAMAG